MLKRFIKYYKPHIPLFSFDMLSAIIVAAASLFYPMIVKDIMNEYIFDDTPRRLIIWSSVLLVLYIAKAYFNYVMGYYGHVVGVRMQANMRSDLFKKYQSLPFSYFDNHKTGDLISRISNDLFDVAELAHHGPENLFLSVLMLAGSFVVLSSINLTLTFIMFAIIPFIVIFTLLSRRSMMSSMSASRKQMAEINSAVENSIGGVRETKSYVAEHHEICKFNISNVNFVKYRTKAMFSLGFFHAIMQFLSDLLYLVIIFIGGLFLYYGKIDAGEFAAFILYISMFLNPINRFVTLFEQLQEGMSGFARFHEIMNEAEEVDEGGIALDDIKGDIVFDDVSFSYLSDSEDEKRMVISNLSLSIKAGQTLALVGPSGGGKSTICNLIPRFYTVNSGKITLDGIDTKDIKLESLRKNIGTVSQNIFLFDGTIKENIAYGAPYATDEEIIEAAKKANIHEFVSSLDEGYDTPVGERGVKLSGGQKQRVAIARVFLKNPKLLILDEATSALDNVTEMQIQSSLETLARGRTVIVVAHRLSTVKNADEIVVIDQSGIVEKGTHDELISLDGEYKKLYQYQFRQY
ncbi:MAG: ABC transporter ATP-binding protein [Ruminococcaceae bacterium]|nr:ABC transporter ATP-binding protein [Oscillospiraceae bacterium]